MQGAESQLAAWVGRTARLRVAFQWVQAPTCGKKHFLLVFRAQNTDTADCSVTQLWWLLRRELRLKSSLSFTFKHMLKSHNFNLHTFWTQLEGHRIRPFISASIEWG